MSLRRLLSRVDALGCGPELPYEVAFGLTVAHVSSYATLNYLHDYSPLLGASWLSSLQAPSVSTYFAVRTRAAHQRSHDMASFPHGEHFHDIF